MPPNGTLLAKELMEQLVQRDVEITRLINELADHRSYIKELEARSIKLQRWIDSVEGSK